MSIIEKSAELEEAVRFALTGVADPAVLRHIMDESARIQAEVRGKFGDRELSLELLREVRDE
jgi:hypothetical protein